MCQRPSLSSCCHNAIVACSCTQRASFHVGSVRSGCPVPQGDALLHAYRCRLRRVQEGYLSAIHRKTELRCVTCPFLVAYDIGYLIWLHQNTTQARPFFGGRRLAHRQSMYH
jgi:hypothetical protein